MPGTYGRIAGPMLVLAAAFAAAACSHEPARRTCAPGDGVKGASNPHARAVEAGLVPAVVSDRTKAQALAERMRFYGVPGVSVAVIHEGKIDWAQGYGLRDTSSCAPVTTDTAFQVASISKTVAALTAMRLVESGKLALDADINTYLSDWKLPPGAGLTPDHVTLRQILSHTAGLTVHGFPGYANGAPLPALVQVLDGAPPANSPAVRMELAPGTQFRYSGGAYLVAQLAMTNATGRSYEALAASEVFEPLGMKRSSVAPAPTAEALGDSARAHSSGQVIEGGYHLYPELAAASVWSTPSDLARLLMGVQAANKGASSYLQVATVREMLTQQAVVDPETGWGLGFALSGPPEHRRFGHNGRNEGFESTMVAYVDQGEGVAVLTNADRGGQLAAELVRAVAGAYGWQGLGARKVVEVDVSAAVLATYAGFYKLDPIQVWIDRRDTHLEARIGGPTSERLIAISPTRFALEASGAVAEFESDSEGKVTGLHILEGGPPVTLARTEAPASPFETTKLYLRGSMNGWSTASPLAAAAPGEFAADIQLAPGAYEFKVASEDWSTVDLGVAGGSEPIAGQAESIGLLTSGANIKLSVKSKGTYRFTVKSHEGKPQLALKRVSD